MVKLNMENMRAKFLALSGVENDDVDRAADFLRTACATLEQLCVEENLQEGDAEKLEFAGAALAARNFLYNEFAREKIICTAAGKGVTEEDFSQRIKAAEKVRVVAFEGVRGIIRDEDFIFLGV